MVATCSGTGPLHRGWQVTGLDSKLLHNGCLAGLDFGEIAMGISSEYMIMDKLAITWSWLKAWL